MVILSLLSWFKDKGMKRRIRGQNLQVTVPLSLIWNSKWFRIHLYFTPWWGSIMPPLIAKTLLVTIFLLPFVETLSHGSWRKWKKNNSTQKLLFFWKLGMRVGWCHSAEWKFFSQEKSTETPTPSIHLTSWKVVSYLSESSEMWSAVTGKLIRFHWL